MTTFDAILPAGGRLDPAFEQVVGTSSKALIRFGDETLLDRAIRSLQETKKVGRIVVIGSDDVRKQIEGRAEFLPEGSSGPDNIRKGLAYLMAAPDPPQKVLVVTTDIPFLDAGQITDFLDRCPPNMDICVPIVRQNVYLRRFPNSHSTWVPLADDRWTMGGIFLIDVRALERAMPQIDRVFANRKSVLGMAKLLGPTFLWKFLRKNLTVKDIEDKVQGMLGCTGTAVMDVGPELAYDIDALDDYQYALEHRV